MSEVEMCQALKVLNNIIKSRSMDAEKESQEIIFLCKKKIISLLKASQEEL